jgi:hypothetical protein
MGTKEAERNRGANLPPGARLRILTSHDGWMDPVRLGLYGLP